MREKTGIKDKFIKDIYLGDEVRLYSMTGTVVKTDGAYGIAFDEIDWGLLEKMIPEETGCDNNPSFCYNDNFISFWEILWNYNCEESVCYMVEIIQRIII